LRSKEARREMKSAEAGFSRSMLKLPKTKWEVILREGEQHIHVLYKASQLTWGGDTSTRWILMGVVSVKALYLKELLLHREERVEYFQLLEMRRPVPPPLPD